MHHHPLLAAQRGATTRTSIPLRRPVIPRSCSSWKLSKRPDGCRSPSRPCAARRELSSLEVTTAKGTSSSRMFCRCSSSCHLGWIGENPRLPCTAERRNMAQQWGKRMGVRARAALSELQTTMTEHHDIIMGPVYRGPLSSADILLQHHPAGWYFSIVVALFTLGITGVQLALLSWSMLERSILATTEEEEVVMLYGVDVSSSQLMLLPEVVRAANFAAEAHEGQFRRTQEPYITHCIETALVVEALLGPQNADTVRARTAMICAVLHDVIDDTHVALEEVQLMFGSEVAGIVSKVSQLSTLNQLLRRQRRLAQSRFGTLGSSDLAGAPVHTRVPTTRIPGLDSLVDDADLRKMILSMVDEPLVILIKVADRLHNMRTIHALRPSKQQAVAHETLSVWCSLAERLGMFAVKSELEDLCFAVLKPQIYEQLYNDLQDFWRVGEVVSGNQGEVRADGTDDNEDGEEVGATQRSSDESQVTRLLATVPRFEAVTFSSQRQLRGRGTRGLADLEACARELLQELSLESYAPGVDLYVQGRLKSLYSVHEKMTSKGVGIEEIYDARALRLIVDDVEGTREAAAIAACYRLLPAVHRLWRPVWHESDDYIANPKASGYQSLHTAVLGPSNIPLEIQIRTASMHEMAEYGTAAHWVYKEGFPSTSSARDVIKAKRAAGQPVLRIAEGRLRDGVVVKATRAGRRLLCATFMGGRLSTDGRRPSWEDYRSLLSYVVHKGWWEAGHGDSRIALEDFVQCSDGQFHRIDHCGHILPTRLQLLDMTPEGNEQRTWGSSSNVAAAAGGAAEEERGGGGCEEGESGGDSSATAPGSTAEQQRTKEKIFLLRSMLEWGREVENTAGIDISESDIMVLLWPNGNIVRLKRGTTAGEILAKQGSIDLVDIGPGGAAGGAEDGPLVNVNNRLVPEATELEDGDMVILTRQILTI